MIVKQFFDPVSSTYTYLLASKRGQECLIIDPVLEKVDDYLKFIGENKLRLVKGFDTHVHADHITGLGKLRQLTRCMVMMGKQSVNEKVSVRYDDGDIIKIEGLSLKAIYTPGHTDDSYSFYMPGFVFTGDALFIRGNGRTDFQNGCSKQLYHSITEKLFSLPENTIVYPGHDYKGENISIISKEKSENKRIAGKSETQFMHTMDNLNLPNPKHMDVAVPANMKLGSDLKGFIDGAFIVSIAEAKKLQEEGKAIFVDLREDNEIEQVGTISGSLLVPYQQLENVLNDTESVLYKALHDTEKEVIFFCAYGERSALALQYIQDRSMKAKHLEDGIQRWLESELGTSNS